MNGGSSCPRTSISPADLHDLKAFWGVIFAGIFLFFVWLFVKSVIRTQGIRYNWFSVILLFFTMGLALYVIFFVQP
jgi:hypothetical protein